MAVPSSGPLRLRGDIGNEFFGNNTGSNISLHAMALGDGQTTPDAFSEWYGYSSAVTVSLDGGQSRTGAPGSSGFGTMTFNVSAPGGRGFTSTNVNQATINNLPGEFTKSFASTGTSTGRWSISTPGNLFPNNSYALQTSTMSISNPSTPLYTLNVNFAVNPGLTGNRASTVFQGSTAGVGIGRSTPFGRVWNSNPNGSGSGVSVSNGGACTTSQFVSAYAVLNGNASGNVSGYSNPGTTGAANPVGGVNAPPFAGNCPQGMQMFARMYYTSNSKVDSRVNATAHMNSSECGCSYNNWIPIAVLPQPCRTTHYASGGGLPTFSSKTYTASVCNSLNGLMDSATSPFAR